MTITLNLRPDVERGLLAQAKARGISLADLIQEIVTREAPPARTGPPPRGTGQELIDACARVRGLLMDEEIDSLFGRTPSASRPVDLS